MMLVRKPMNTKRKPQRQVRQQETALSQRMASAMPYALLLLCLMLVGGGVIYLPRMLDAWPIRHVSVKGVALQQRQQQLSAALESKLMGHNFFTVSLDALRQQALTLSWLAKADVSRKWPDSLVVKVSERVPVAVWNNDQLVSNKGQVFADSQGYDTGKLPHLFGARQDVDQVMRYYRSISKALGGIGLTVKRLRVNTRLTARLTLTNGVRVVVDRESFAFKLRRFARLYKSVLSKKGKPIKRVDLRYANGVAVEFSDKNMGV